MPDYSELGAVFVIGTGRSGTHWLGYSLANHPEIRATIEAEPMFGWSTSIALSPNLEDPLFEKLIRVYKRQILESRPKLYLDKTHPNIWIADKLRLSFPRSLFIGIERNPYATVASMMKHKGVSGWHDRWRDFPVPNRFLGITTEMAKRYDGMPFAEKCALRWNAHHNRMNELKDALGDSLHVISYESFARNTSAEIRELQQFLNLHDPIPVPDVKLESLKKWKNELSKEEIFQIQSVVGFPPDCDTDDEQIADAIPILPQSLQHKSSSIFLMYNPNGVVERDICLASENTGLQVEPYGIHVSKTSEGHTLERIDLLEVAKTILTMNPDFALSINGSGLDNDGLFAYLCAFMRLPLVLWYVDEPFVIPEWGLKYIPETTIAFTFDRFYERHLRSLGIPWVHTLPLGANAERLRGYTGNPPKEVVFRHPVSFVGALEYEKIQYLLQNISRLWPDMPTGMVDVLDRTVPAYRNDFLRDTEEVLMDCASELGARFSFPNGIVKQAILSYIDREAGLRQRHEIVDSLKPFGIGVYGEPFWEKAVGRKHYKGRINYYSPEIASLYRSSKVNLNISKYQLKTTANQRVFDCPLCDGFLITDFREDLEEYFRIGEEMVVYRDGEDLQKKITSYLGDDRKRRRIVENGKAAVMDRHTYRHRLSRMIDIVANTQKTPLFHRACEMAVRKPAPPNFHILMDKLRQEYPDLRGPVQGRPPVSHIHSS